MLESLATGTFDGCLGEVFRVYPEGPEPLEFELISASGPGENSGRGRPFSILFRGPGEVQLPQCIYRMEHEKIGPSTCSSSPSVRTRKGTATRRSSPSTVPKLRR